jgi:PAS domain S-box-containing protein
MFEIAFLSTAQISLLPAVVMAVALLWGWRWSIATALVICAIALLLQDDPWPTALTMPFAAAGGQLLRWGARCVSAALVQLLPHLFLYIQSLPGTALDRPLSIAATALTEASVNVALASACLILLPQRGRHTGQRARVHAGHIVFTLISGVSGLTALGLLGELPPGMPVDESSMRLCSLLLAALALSQVVTWRATTRLMSVQRWLSGDTKTSPAVPALLEETISPLLREMHHLRRDIAHRRQDLLAAEQEIEQMRQAAEVAQRDLKLCAQQVRRKRRELEAVRNRYRVLMNHCSDVTLFATREGKIESASRSIATLLGYEPVAMKGQRLGVLIPAHQTLEHPLNLTQLEKVRAGTRPIETILRTAEGKEVSAYVQITPYAQADGDRYAIHVRDPSGMRAAITALKRAQKLTESAQRSRDLFIATMSHELRTPLHGLMATLEMMRADQSSPQELQQRLSVARLSARSLLKIANDILDLTRINSGHFTLQDEVFSLARLLHEVIDASRAQADSLHLSLSLQLPSTLPPSFHGDPTRLKQIMNNLISNALKCTTRGGIHLNVAYDGRQITIDVIDTGEGVPVDRRHAIFDPFVQVETATSRHGGTGLGLPISRRLAQAMGGDLVLLRSSTAGSVFRLTVALGASHETPPDEQTQRIFRNPRGRILVVEDNSTNRFVAEALLLNLQCPATIVDNGEDALRLMSQEQFDLILMDCQMPGMDGYQTTRRLRAMLPHRIPIIAMTANAMADDRPRCLEAGMDDFLPKPFGRAALHDILCKWLRPGEQPRARVVPGERLSNLPDMDTQVFDELRHSLNHQRAPLQRICDSFVDSTEQTLSLLDGSERDTPKLKRYLHSLLGSAGMVGARRVEHLAGYLQTVVTDGDEAGAAAAAPALRQSMQRFHREFQRRISEDS